MPEQKMPASFVLASPVERQAFGFSVEYVPPSPEDRNKSSFRNIVFSVCRNPDDGQSPEA
jgi:hypothetical protein